MKVDAGGDFVEEMRGEKGGRVPLTFKHTQTEKQTHIRMDTHLFEIALRKKKGEKKRGIVPPKRQEKEQINGGMIMNYFLAREGVRGER